MPKTGKQITETKRELMLKDYGIQSKDKRINGSVVKVYVRAAFEDAWKAYLLRVQWFTTRNVATTP